jgi:archaellin
MSLFLKGRYSGRAGVTKNYPKDNHTQAMIVKLDIYLELANHTSPINISPNVTLISCRDKEKYHYNIYYSRDQIRFIGKTNGDLWLNKGELAKFTLGGVNQAKFSEYNGSFIAIGPDQDFFVEFKLSDGRLFQLHKRTPLIITKVVSFTT